MRHFLASVLISGIVTAPAIASQARGAASGSRIRACSVLTRDVVMKFGTDQGKRVVDLVKPMVACTDQLRKSPGKDWQPVSGVGDTAYFRANGTNYAELMVWSGTHHFTIQMGVSMGSTPEAIKPNTIALANAIIPKLA